MSVASKKCLFPGAELKKPELHLKAYTSEAIEVEGVFPVQVKYGNYLGSWNCMWWKEQVPPFWGEIGLAQSRGSVCGFPTKSLSSMLELHSPSV